MLLRVSYIYEQETRKRAKAVINGGLQVSCLFIHSLAVVVVVVMGY